MKISQRLLTSAAALGFVITTLTTGASAPVANAETLPDVALTYKGYKLGAVGEIVVSLGVTNKFQDADVKLITTCTYRKSSDLSLAPDEVKSEAFGMPKTQSNPVPKSVVCYPDAGYFVSSIYTIADVAQGDSDPSNNSNSWDHITKMEKPDIRVSLVSGAPLKNGAASAQFAVTNPTTQDAPVVGTLTECYYYDVKTLAFAHQTMQSVGPISVQHGASLPRTVACAPVVGQYVGEIHLTTFVQKPQTDADTSNNAAAWSK